MMSDIPMKRGEEKKKRFEEIYKKYSALIIKAVYDMTSDFNIAEEICQHVFMLCFIHMDKIVPGCDKTWLLLTAKRLVIDHFKKASTRNEKLLLDVKDEKASGEDADDIIDKVMKTMAEKELSSEILHDLKRKNRSWYRIISGIYMEERSIEEIAEELGISVSRLYSKMYRAKTYIRKRYGKVYMEYLEWFDK